MNPLNPYFGATVGRVANRIGYGKIKIDDNIYNVTQNLGQHQLHGGLKGFDKVIYTQLMDFCTLKQFQINWEYHVEGTKVIMSYDSADKEEGFPGNVLVNITYQLNDKNEFLIDYKATTTKPTFVNLTNHSYFNLSGHNAGAKELYNHVVTINADQITDVDKDSIPSGRNQIIAYPILTSTFLGKLLPVADTIFDLQVPKKLGDVINKIPGYNGYDHNFCINKGTSQESTFVAKYSFGYC